MFPGRDILERKFEGHTDAEIFAMAREVHDAADAALVRRGTSLAELYQQAEETALAADAPTKTEASGKSKGRGKKPVPPGIGKTETDMGDSSPQDDPPTA